MEESTFDPGPSRLVNRKRRCSESIEEEEQPASKVLIEDAKSCMIQLCCDEIMMEIFKHLDSNSLQAIRRTCCRFYNLVSDRRLWHDIDLTSEGLPLNEICSRLGNMNTLTKRISVRGLAETYPEKTWNSVTVSKKLFERIAEICPALETLEIHNGFMNFEDIAIRDFPETLKKLVFDDCLVKFPSKLGATSFFTGIDAHLLYLEELTLANCNWFDTHDLVLFSKLKNLKKLSLRGCESLKDCVPYGSISTRFGFKKLEELDVRDTPISDSDIQCFNVTYTLQTLKLECPEDLRDPNTSSSTKRPVSRRRPSPYAMNNNSNSASDSDDTNVFHLVINDYSAINVNLPRGNSNGRHHIVYLVNPRREAQQAAAAQNGAAEQQPEQQPGQPQAVQPMQIHQLNGPEAAAQEQPRIQPEQAAEQPQPQQQEAAMPALPYPRHLNLVDPNRLISRTLWFERRYPYPAFSPPRIHPISDMAVCSFGSPRIPVHGVIRIQAEPRPPDTNLRTLVVRHYKQISDTSLNHLTICAPKLIFLDFTGTSVTADGILKFKQQNPNCYIVSDHFTG